MESIGTARGAVVAAKDGDGLDAFADQREALRRYRGQGLGASLAGGQNDSRQAGWQKQD